MLGSEDRKSKFLQVRIPGDLDHAFSSVCSDIGISKSTCVRLFIMKMVSQLRQSPETRQATALEQIDWAEREVRFYTPVFRMQKEAGARF